MNHYDTLGVDPGADKEAIKHSYRLKALKYHPDRCPDADARQRFLEITEAYEVHHLCLPCISLHEMLHLLAGFCNTAQAETSQADLEL